jgi:hypothetical protein
LKKRSQKREWFEGDDEVKIAETEKNVACIARNVENIAEDEKKIER